jgi:hypothetical protein
MFFVNHEVAPSAPQRNPLQLVADESHYLVVQPRCSREAAIGFILWCISTLMPFPQTNSDSRPWVPTIPRSCSCVGLGRSPECNSAPSSFIVHRKTLLRLSACSFCDSCLDHVPDQTSIALCECEFICEAGFQEYADTVMAGQVSRGNQDLVLGHSKVCEVVQFCQYKETFGDRGLNFRHFLPKILEERFL